MEKVIVYLDDAGYARQQIAAAGASPTHWVLVACAPRMTHRISKWVSHSSRESWRSRWADKLFDEVVPALRARGDAVSLVLARGPLPELTRALMAEHATERVMDMRRPKAPDGDDTRRWIPGTLLGFGALLMLSLDGA